ncbi:MAG: hypothetical protein JKY34_07230 [Kordiimonadaceae bacterium]|nr:hypothetical protein [Kordiimonadaceae bacterium]
MSTKFAEGETYPSASVIDAARDKAAACAQSLEGHRGDATSGEAWAREAWARAVVNLVDVYLAIPNLRAARDLTEGLEAAAHNELGELGEPVLHDLWVGAMIKVVEAYGPSHFDDKIMSDLLARLSARMATTHPADGEMRAKWAEHICAILHVVGEYARLKWEGNGAALVRGLGQAVQEYPQEAALREQWAQASVDLVKAFRRSDPFGTNFDASAAALKMLAPLYQMMRQHPEDAGFRVQCAKATVDAILTCKRAKQVDQALDALALWEDMSRPYREDLDLREQWGLAVVAAAAGACHTVDDVDRAQALLTVLENEMARRKDDVTDRARWAMALKEMSAACCIHREWISVIESLEARLKKVAQAHPTDMTMHEHWVLSVWDVALTYSHHKEWKRLRRLLKNTLKTVKKRIPRNRVSRAQWATRVAHMFRLADEFKGAGMVDTGHALLAVLQKAALTHQDEGLLLEKWLVATVAMKKGLEKGLGLAAPKVLITGNGLGDGRAMVRSLKRVTKELPKNPALIEPWMGHVVFHFQMLKCFIHPKALSVGGKLLDKAYQTTLKHPNNAALRAQWAGCARALSVAYGAGEDWTTARDLLETLGAVAKQFPEDLAVRGERHGLIVELLKGCCNEYGPPDHNWKAALPTARALLKELEGEVAKYPEDRLLRNEWASKISRAIYAHRMSDRPDVMISFLASLAPVCTAYPYEPKLREHWRQGTYSLIGICRKAGELDVARTVFDKLEPFLRFDPYDEAMRSGWASEANYLIEEYRLAKRRDGMAEMQACLDQMAQDYPSERAHSIKYGPGPRMYAWAS